MSDHDSDDWFTESYRVIDAAGGDSSRVQDAIAEHLAGPPVAALIGSFDAGKSTLVKRLCIDDGLPVPATLVISGEPSTAGVDDVQVGQWLIRDTPGVDSDTEGQIEVARHAALSSEKTYFLLLPNLFSEHSETAALLKELEPGTVEIILSQADKPMLSPTAESVRDWVATKADEARALAARLGHPEIQVRAVAADPGGRVANRTATRERFDNHRAWDGIAQFRSELNEVCPPELRKLAAKRQVVLALQDMQRRVEEDSRRATDVASTHAQDAEAAMAHIDRLRRWQPDAKTELTETLRDAARQRPAASARGRVIVAADKWLDDWDRRLEDAAQEWKLDFLPWRGDLSTLAAMPQVEGDEAEQADSAGREEAAKKLISEQMKRLNGDEAGVRELEKQLKALDKAKRRGKAREYYADGKTPFDGIADAREARARVDRFNQLRVAGEVGLAALGAWNEERTIRQHEAKQEAADAAALELADGLAVSVARLLFDGNDEGDGYRATFGSLVGQLQAQQADADALRERSTEELNRLQGVSAEIHRLSGQ